MSAKSNIGPIENMRLTWRLLRDPKVAPHAKLVLPILAVVYLISPIDLIPDFMLGLGQIDDIGVIGLVAYFLVRFVRRTGLSTFQESAGVRFTGRPSDDDNVIDATYRVVSDPRPGKNEKSPF